MAIDKAHLVIKNGKSITGTFATAPEARQSAKDQRDKFPRATFWYAEIKRVYYTEETPPVFTPVEEVPV